MDDNSLENLVLEATKQALKEVTEEKRRELVNKYKQRIKWPWYKKLFPYKITIKVIDLRKDDI